MFRKLLVPLDRSSFAEDAIGRAVAIARESHAAVDVVLVHKPLFLAGSRDAPWDIEQWNDEHKYVETIAEEISSGGAVATTHAVLRGDAVEMICRRSHDVDADLVVMTSHGRTGFSRSWFGSVADGVLRRSAIPVLILPAVTTKTDRRAAHHLFKRILVLVDGSALSMEILPSASALARCSSAGILLLRVVQPATVIALNAATAFMYPPMIYDEAATQCAVDEAKQQLSDVARTLAVQGIDDVKTDVIVASLVPRAILDFARGHRVSAIAMSTHGRGASRLIIGGVADKVLRASGLPVLLSRPVVVGDEQALVNAARIEEQAPALAPG